MEGNFAWRFPRLSVIIEALPAAVGEAGALLLCDASAIALLSLPVAVFAVLAAVSVRRRVSRAGYLLFSCACLSLFLALFLAAGEAVLPALSIALCAFALYALLAGILCLIRPKRSRPHAAKKRRPPEEDASEEGDTPAPSPSLPPSPVPALPRKVRCLSGAERVVVGEDVRLGHIFSVLERLRSLPLGAGDGLEAQKAEDLLEVYRGKGDLSPEEARTLNDILASLLKMLAKYEG